MKKKYAVISFLFLLFSLKAQIIYNNQFKGYFLKVDGGMSWNTLSRGVIDESSGTRFGLSTKKNDKLSPHINIGFVSYKSQYFAWNIGLMYTEASLKYRIGHKSSPFSVDGKNPPYVYDRYIYEGEGYLFRKLVGINGGVYIRTPIFDLKINIGLCKYFTFKRINYYQETYYKVYGSSTQFHTEELHNHNGSFILTVPNDSVVQVTSELLVTNEIEETNNIGGNRIINPTYLSVPLEFSIEKSVIIKPVILSLGLRASLGGIANYIGVGFYLGVGFGRLK